MSASVKKASSTLVRRPPAGDARKLKFEICPIAGALGAEILGPDLNQPISDSMFADIYRALLDHLVIFFRNQRPISPQQQTAIAAHFGEVDMQPAFNQLFDVPSIKDHPQFVVNVKEAGDRTLNVGGFWHADVTYRDRPHKVAVLYAHDVPPYGGDTMFANQYLAYETLSPGMKQMLSELRAVHGSDMRYGQENARFASVSRTNAPRPEDRKFSGTPGDYGTALVESEHPVVRTHPETGRKCLFVNRGFTSRFVGMTGEESRVFLEYLWNHATQAEFTCRYRWAPHDIGIWDNRCVLHYALNDYSGARREMRRVSVHEPTRPA
jgi:taurine dioxygenase